MSLTAGQYRRLSAAAYEVLPPSPERFEEFEAHQEFPLRPGYGLPAQDTMELLCRSTERRRKFSQQDNTVTFASVGLTMNVEPLPTHPLRSPGANVGGMRGGTRQCRARQSFAPGEKQNVGDADGMVQVRSEGAKPGE